MAHLFSITDVFSEGRYGGNQLATVFDAADISDAEMQQIARAFNFAETTFICGGDEHNGFDVRIFTPVKELPFAGHPTLGTAFLIREKLLDGAVSEVRLNLGVGQIPVSFTPDGVLWMLQQEPTLNAGPDVSELLRQVGLTAADHDARFPVQLVSTGLPFTVVPLRDMDALVRARPVPDCDHLLLFAPGGYEPGQSHGVRMFAGQLGVMEDAATGSAAGCLAAYLSHHQIQGSTVVDTVVGQGYLVNRPSQLYLRTTPADGLIRVQVGGRVQLAGEGEWVL